MPGSYKGGSMHRKYRMPAGLGMATALGIGLLFCCSPRLEQVPYPEGYREWAHNKSMLIEKGHPLYNNFGGIHHVYANRPALEALRRGGPYPDGSVFVFDLLAVERKDNAVTEGGRKVVGVMHKNAASFPKSDGWGYEGFAGDTRNRVVQDMVANCHACHRSVAGQDYVFETMRK